MTSVVSDFKMTVVNKYSHREACSLLWHSVHRTNDPVGKLCVSTLLSFQDIFKEDSALGIAKLNLGAV